MDGRLVGSRFLRALRRHTGTARRQHCIDVAFKCDDINMSAMARVSVARKSRFLYNRVQKNANSSLITLVHWLEMGHTLGVMASRRNVPRLDDWPISQISDLAALPRMVVVRNPYSRTLSAFLNKVDTPRFRADIGALAATQDGFHRFLRSLEDGGMTRNSHWDLQTKQIFLSLDHYDDVIRFERLEEGLATFLERLGIDPCVMQQSKAFGHGRAHRTDADDRLRHFYNTESVGIVRRLFAKDFDALGYAPDWRSDD